jgi:hypothetical protein
MLTKKELAKQQSTFMARAREACRVARIAHEAGLSGYFWPDTIGFGINPGLIVRISDLSELGQMSEKIHAAFPEAKREKEPEVWSPYGDLVMIQWRFRVSLNMYVKVWLERTISTIPDGVLKPGCVFREQEKNTSYALECLVV